MAELMLCLDFDGVIHSYTSGWQGAKVIPDPPVPGALEFICKATDHFKVSIFSSRSNQWGGTRAMRHWLYRQYRNISGINFCDKWHIPWYERGEIAKWWFDYISRTAFADPWPDEAGYALHQLMKKIQFPKKKPPAFVSIDDRAITFSGTFPEVQGLKAFKPWNRQEV